MKSWTIKTLGEITIIVNGGTPKSNLPEYWDGDVPWITPKDMGKLKSSYVSNTIRTISQSGLRKSSAKLIPENSVILSTRAPIGHLAINQVAMATNQGCRGLVPKSDLETKFLFYFLRFNIQLLDNLGTGTTFKELSTNALASVKIPLPPLSEQKRIVSIVDQAFEGIDRAIANTKKNLTNARELFESYLNAIFTQKSNDWVEKKLSEIGGKVFTGPFGSLLHKSDYISNGIPIVNPANIEDGEIVPNSNKTVSQDVITRLKAYVLSENDIVIGRRGEIGRCAVVREEQAGWLCGSGSFFIKTFEDVDSAFLTHLFRSARYRNQLEALSAGATMQNLSNQALSGLLIAVPPLDDQNRTTDKLDELKAETKRLEAIYQRKLAALNELKQSILQKAFTGELTTDTANQTTKKAEDAIAA